MGPFDDGHDDEASGPEARGATSPSQNATRCVAVGAIGAAVVIETKVLKSNDIEPPTHLAARITSEVGAL